MSDSIRNFTSHAIIWDDATQVASGVILADGETYGPHTINLAGADWSLVDDCIQKGTACLSMQPYVRSVSSLFPATYTRYDATLNGVPCVAIDVNVGPVLEHDNTAWKRFAELLKIGRYRFCISGWIKEFVGSKVSKYVPDPTPYIMLNNDDEVY